MNVGWSRLILPAIRTSLPFTSAALALALLYVLWVGAQRFLSHDEIERALQLKRKPQPAFVPLPGTGGTEVNILQFYAGTGEIVEGDRAIVCYGVENARAVRLEPPVERLTPTLNRCFWVAPERTTTYTLTADGNNGKRVSASFTVTVKPAPPSLLFLAQSDEEIVRGQPATFCYGLKYATSARLLPLGMPLATGPKHCVRFYPPRTIEYTLLATGVGGETREKFSIKVKDRASVRAVKAAPR